MFKYRVFFELHYKACFGEFLVLVGNCKELGNWDVSKGLRLQWTNGHIWKASASLHHNCKQNCEYKYVLCREASSPSQIEILRWEEGPNRLITFNNIKNLIFSLTDVWGHRKLCFRVPNTCTKPTQSLKITGDIPQMGNFMRFYDMQLVYKKQKNSGLKEQFWEVEFLVDPIDREISYCYVLYDSEARAKVYERKKFRSVELGFLMETDENFQKNQRDSRGTRLKNDRFTVFDFEFQNKFLFDEITQNIFLGPCPQNKEEVESLEKYGVKAVLNLQRLVDMEQMDIDWTSMKEIYASKNMDVINYQIKDRSPEIVGEKLLKAAFILNVMIQKFDKVYVHCTAGKNRSPYTVMAYLCLYQKVPMAKAVETMKAKRPAAFAKKNMLQKVIQLNKQVNQYGFYV